MTTTSPTAAVEPAVSGIRRPRFGFVLAIVTQIAMMMGASAPSPFYPVLAAEIGFDAIVISAVFAVYAVALLLALLSAGSLSDHVGRRPVVIGGLLLLAASMVLFWHADTVATLVLARILQGGASGVLIAALSAAALDLAPGGRSRVAALWNALSPGIGLALGALLAGIALDLTGQPLLDVFAPLTLAYLVLAALFLLAPETAPLRPGAWGSLRFRLSVPVAIRADFWRGAPAVIAGWATGGLFLSLGANIVRAELGGEAHVWQGLAVAMLAGVGAITAFLLRTRSPRTSVVFGTAALATGTALSLVALSLASLPFYLAATAITGMGFGTAFSGVVASLAPRIPATDRADTFAVIYVLAYLAFGVPAVIAGMLVGLFGLGVVCVGYGIVVIALAVIALVLRLRQPE
ncbi:MFS transporter [Microbacterium foliorum]|uniref:Multidrug resistance protein D n=1 Tax=Microbacterium foliorum TaxID=104336 RepID=A0A0F0KVP7_9MICO|nr:MFS transporter [Microbacterium foliorum]AXL10928.1 MFS transporter [Microbacterium foliorum]KJL24554.1 multidrug resistance protein D [Microbacterium foliorum]